MDDKGIIPKWQRAQQNIGQPLRNAQDICEAGKQLGWPLTLIQQGWGSWNLAAFSGKHTGWFAPSDPGMSVLASEILWENMKSAAVANQPKKQLNLQVVSFTPQVTSLPSPGSKTGGEGDRVPPLKEWLSPRTQHKPTSPAQWVWVWANSRR